ncbi:helix-turn-helix domain-containing protein [Streptomyces sp. SID4913]|nr:helix-turn-helix domain-containing protein [Streptomyces sp. SID4913]
MRHRDCLVGSPPLARRAPARTAAEAALRRPLRASGGEPTVHRIEYGTSDPRLSMLLRLAAALGVPLADLVRE